MSVANSNDGEFSKYNDKRVTLNKAHLLEPIVRHRIQDSIFYKQYLFLSNEATILPIIAREVKSVGGLDSSMRPSPFICCLLRLLELEPRPEMIRIYLDQLGFNEFKYLTTLTLLYIRIAWKSEEIYTILDRYYSDYRKIRFQLKTPKFDDKSVPVNYEISYLDSWIDELLNEERVIGIMLPRLVPRSQLLEKGLIEERKYNIDSEKESSDNSEEESYKSDSD